MLSLHLILMALGVILVLGFIYLFRRQLLAFALHRGIGLIQRLALRVVLAVSDSEELPGWILVKETNGHTSLGLLTQRGPRVSTVFLPTGPRLFPGQLRFITNENWRSLDLDFEEGLTMLLTLGMLPETKSLSSNIWNRMEEF